MNSKNKSVEKNIIEGTFIILLMTLLSKATSFITDSILAARLGVSYQADAYYMIAEIQNVIYPMISVGIWKVFLPLYKSHVAKDEQDIADGLANKAITLFTGISIVISVLIFCFSNFVVSVVAPGFEGETRILCGKLVKLSSFMYVFTISAALYSCILQCHNRFVGSQIREVVTYIPTIIAALLFYNTYGVYGLAVSLVCGSVLRFFVQLPFINWGFRYKIDFKFKNTEIGLLAKRLPSALLSAGIAKVNTLVDKIMASSLPTGSVSSLSYGGKLLHVFSGTISTSVSTAFYPQIVELVAQNKKDKLNELMTRVECIFAFLMLPISVWCFAFSDDIVKVVFQRGAFSTDAAQLTAGIFSCYCLEFFFTACNSIMSNVFYSNGNTKTPVLISLFHLAINVGLNSLFIPFWGAKGLALATAVSAICAFAIRCILLKKYTTVNYKKLVTVSAKAIIGGIIACFVSQFLCNLFSVNKYFDIILEGIIFVIAYIVFMVILKEEELISVIQLVKRKIGR